MIICCAIKNTNYENIPMKKVSNARFKCLFSIEKSFDNAQEYEQLLSNTGLACPYEFLLLSRINFDIFQH